MLYLAFRNATVSSRLRTKDGIDSVSYSYPDPAFLWSVCGFNWTSLAGILLAVSISVPGEKITLETLEELQGKMLY